MHYGACGDVTCISSYTLNLKNCNTSHLANQLYFNKLGQEMHLKHEVLLLQTVGFHRKHKANRKPAFYSFMCRIKGQRDCSIEKCKGLEMRDTQNWQLAAFWLCKISCSKTELIHLTFTSCLSLRLATLTDADDKRKATVTTTVTKQSLASQGSLCHCPLHLRSALCPIREVSQALLYLWAKSIQKGLSSMRLGGNKKKCAWVTDMNNWKVLNEANSIRHLLLQEPLTYLGK